MSRPGLNGRTVITVDDAGRQRLEQLAQAHHDNPTCGHIWCPRCQRHTWRSHTDAVCRHCCTHQATIPGYLVKRNGHWHAQHQCLTCGQRTDIRRTDPRPILNICLLDNTAGPYPTPPCARCETTDGCELHHFAPRAIFNDADDWPMAWLCPTHHQQWHNAMRAAAGVSLPKADRIGIDPWARIDGVA